MAFDLRRALLKKGEIETARLDDFEFRLRACTWRAMEDALNLPGLATRAAEADDEILLTRLAEELQQPFAALGVCFIEQRSIAHATLVAERGDPSPVRWA